MTRDDIRETVAHAIADIAPDADLDAIDPGASLRDELDLDSMDMLALARRLHEDLGVDIPETDYAKIDSLEGCVGYLAAALGA